MKAVWTAANDKLGRLLIVEKNFNYPADHTSNSDHINKHDELKNTPFYIKDAVDDVIEMVLKYGGDVIFVEEGVLAEFDHIALIQYY